MKSIKHDAVYQEAIEQAERDFRAPNAQGFKCPYIWSSEFADAYQITLYTLYHSGKKPYALHKSKGHSWLVDTGIVQRMVVSTPDHRNGILITPA